MGDVMDNFPIVDVQDNSRGQVVNKEKIVNALFKLATFHHLKIKVIINDDDINCVEGVA